MAYKYLPHPSTRSTTIHIASTDTLCLSAYFDLMPGLNCLYLVPCCRYETTAAIIETETSTAELAQEVHNQATQAQIAARETALLAEVTATLCLRRRQTDVV